MKGLADLRTTCNTPGATDIQAANNRVIALEWLYRTFGQTNHTYTGLYQKYLQLKEQQEKEV